MNSIFWPDTAQNVKYLNKHVVIDMIRFTPGGITRADLARTLGLSRAALTIIVNDLAAAGLVREVEAHHAGGRKPIVLEINPELGYAGQTHLNFSCVTILR
jgi:predicted transcriptional regulator